MVANRGKWAIITGASSGIGAATAAALAKCGYSLLLVARREERLQELKAKLQSQHAGKIEYVSMDVREVERWPELLKQHAEVFENLQLLVNNAGLAKGIEKMQEAQLADWDEMLDTNVRSLLHLTRHALPFLLRQPQAQIVNLGSVAGRWVYPGGGVYCASKFAVRALTEGLRMDLLGTNVRVSNIEPGMVESEFSVVRFGDQNKADQVYAGMNPLTPQDIAEVITWVISRPAHVNIQELVVFPTAQAAVGQVARQAKV